MGSSVITGMTCRATRVPLSWLISATIDTASGESADFAARVSVPVIVAVAAADGRRKRDRDVRRRAAGDDRDGLDALVARVPVDHAREQRVAVRGIDVGVVVVHREVGGERDAVDALLPDDHARARGRLLVDDRDHRDRVGASVTGSAVVRRARDLGRCGEGRCGHEPGQDEQDEERCMDPAHRNLRVQDP